MKKIDSSIFCSIGTTAARNISQAHASNLPLPKLEPYVHGGQNQNT
jgi:hypothetical protein